MSQCGKATFGLRSHLALAQHIDTSSTGSYLGRAFGLGPEIEWFSDS